MRTRTRWGRSLATVTLAIVAVLAMAASGGAAEVKVPDVFGGQSKASALELAVVTPLINVTQTIAQTVGEATHTPTALSKSILGTGTLINQAIEAKIGEDKSGSMLGLDNMGINLGVGTMTASATALPKAVSMSELVGLKVNLAPVADLIDAQAPGITDNVQAIADGANTILGVVNDALEQVATGINDLGLGTTLKLDLGTLPNPLKVDLVRIDKLVSTSSVLRDGALVKSEATSQVLGLDILAAPGQKGVIHADVISLSAAAEAAGVPGSAKATTVRKILGLKVGNTEVLDITDGVIKIAGSELPVATKDIVDTVTGLLSGALTTLGVEISTLLNPTTQASPDGKSAMAAINSLSLKVRPLAAIGALPVGEGTVPVDVNSLMVSLSLPGAAAAVNAAQLPTTLLAANQLPRTGGAAAAVLLGGMMMAGAFGLKKISFRPER
ncbi:MAG: hypothetical protein WDA71_09770 [Actinomycetota bacterium]